MQQRKPKIKAGRASRAPTVTVSAMFAPSSGLACAAIVLATFLALYQFAGWGIRL